MLSSSVKYQYRNKYTLVDGTEVYGKYHDNVFAAREARRSMIASHLPTTLNGVRITKENLVMNGHCEPERGVFGFWDSVPALHSIEGKSFVIVHDILD